MKLLKITCIVLFLFINTRSEAQNIDVVVDYAAKYFLKPDTNTVVLINQFDVSRSKVTNKKTLGVLKAAAYTAINYAGFELSQLPHTKIINLVDSVAFTVNTDSVKHIALKYHANYVLALKNFDAKISLADMDLSPTLYNSSSSVNFILYEDNGVFFRKLDGTAEDPQPQQIDAGLMASLIFHPTIKGNKESIKTSAEHSTENALQDFFPYNITHTRPLFDDKFLRPINKEIIAGNLDKADSLLQPFLQDVDVKVAAKAAYTLAIVYESENDIEGAMDMAEESNEKFKNNYATAMLADLKEE